jgi:hypothetical protein
MSAVDLAAGPEPPEKKAKAKPPRAEEHAYYHVVVQVRCIGHCLLPANGWVTSAGPAPCRTMALACPTIRSRACWPKVCALLLSGRSHQPIWTSLFYADAVLSGTKYTLKQARGRFGLGAKMVGPMFAVCNAKGAAVAAVAPTAGCWRAQALIWAKMTSGIALEVYTARQGQAFISHCLLDIDLHLNEPKAGQPCILLGEAAPRPSCLRRCGCAQVHVHEKLPNDGSVCPRQSSISRRLFGANPDLLEPAVPLPDQWHGTHIAVVIQGNWSDGGSGWRWWGLDLWGPAGAHGGGRDRRPWRLPLEHYQVHASPGCDYPVRRVPSAVPRLGGGARKAAEHENLVPTSVPGCAT